ncbi:MAG: DnaB-like helicase N-terminal domain-containing protein, partial [Patescibacteria group bacterium]
MAKNLRIPPQNLDSEKAFLGSIMLRPDSVHEVIDTIDPDDFYADKHRVIYKAMLALLGKSEPIDLLSVSAKLKENKQFEQVGGNSYLSELANSVP